MREDLASEMGLSECVSLPRSQIRQLWFHAPSPQYGLGEAGLDGYTVTYSLMRGRIKGPRPLVNPMQSDKTFISHVIKILHGNSTPKATNL